MCVCVCVFPVDCRAVLLQQGTATEYWGSLPTKTPIYSSGALGDVLVCAQNTPKGFVASIIGQSVKALQIVNHEVQSGAAVSAAGLLMLTGYRY